MKKSQFKKIRPWITVVVWMGAIFYLSHQPGNESSDLSSGITETIIQTIQTIFPFIPIDEVLFHHLIRKSAHFTAYFVLGMLVVHALKRPFQKGFVYALVICILYATSDEVHQLFIPGRSGEVRDVLIDSAGAVTGIGAYIVCAVVFRRFKRKRKRKISGY